MDLKIQKPHNGKFGVRDNTHTPFEDQINQPEARVSSLKLSGQIFIYCLLLWQSHQHHHAQHITSLPGYYLFFFLINLSHIWQKSLLRYIFTFQLFEFLSFANINATLLIFYYQKGIGLPKFSSSETKLRTS